MNIEKITKHHFILAIAIFLFLSCSNEDDFCTKRVNIPLWNEEKEIFEDNFQELPCNFNGESKKIVYFTSKEKKD